jgi:hypothetical protein
MTEEGKRAIWLSIMMGFFAVMWFFGQQALCPVKSRFGL